VDATGVYPGGAEANGFDGLKTYIHEQREQQFIDTLSRRLFAYSLNRSLQLSDEPVVEEMESRLRDRGYHFSALIETIVTSPQFLNARVAMKRETPEVAQSRR
jgi:hypothetical protein